MLAVRFNSVASLAMCSLVLLPVTLAQPGATLAARRAQLRDAIEQEWQHELMTTPEFATAIGDPRYNDRLYDLSLIHI